MMTSKDRESKWELVALKAEKDQSDIPIETTKSGCKIRQGTKLSTYTEPIDLLQK